MGHIPYDELMEAREDYSRCICVYSEDICYSIQEYPIVYTIYFELYKKHKYSLYQKIYSERSEDHYESQKNTF